MNENEEFVEIDNLPIISTSILVSEKVYHNPLSYHALVNDAEKRILCVSPWMGVVNTLASFQLNTTVIFNINHKKRGTLTEEFNNKLPWRYVYNYQIKKYELEAHVTKYLKKDVDRYMLIAEKCAILNHIYLGISALRKELCNDIILQEKIYDYKEKEVEKYDRYFLTNNTEINKLEVPYISTYAEIMEIDLSKAVDIIRLKSDIQKSRLLNTECLRLKTIKALRECEDINSLYTILSNFDKENFVYGNI